MKTKFSFNFSCCMLFLTLLLDLLMFGPAAAQEKSAETIIADFASSYKAKVTGEQAEIFGIQIQGEGGGEWYVQVEPGRKVTLHSGMPPQPTFCFTMDLATLKKIQRKEINVLTAMGRARASDKAPADIIFMKDFNPTPETMGRILPLPFHFFTLGTPEFISFGEEFSRFVHGGNMVLFYYETGLRTAWAQIKKGMVINKDVKDQVNPFPTLAIGIKGKAKAKLGEKVYLLEEGMAVYIPAGMPHQVWNESDEPAECILIMFGKGA
jgi:mannose-6-phosphate isomerase-like protein (cupin superfamily)/putative sterol carrier protein